MPLLSVRRYALTSALAAALLLPSVLFAQDNSKTIVEPVYRLSHNTNDNSTNETANSKTEAATTQPNEAETKKPHPLDHALELAEKGLENFQTNIRDYTAIMVKRERINDELLDPEYFSVKIRNARTVDGTDVPFSIYMKFLKPRKNKGQEVIWVDGRNNGKICAHGAPPIANLVKVNLDPEGSMAMKNNRYPIYEAGIENLVLKLIEKGTRDRAAGDCKVRFVEGTKINGRSCTMIEVVHDVQREPYEFHKAQIFIDEELEIPVRYAAYLWPEQAGGKPQLLEEYTYVNIELNVGLTDKDFDPSNEEYGYPR